MNTKKRALKGLLILTCFLLVCMFFARTVQTITTAKVQKITATRGKLEDQIPVQGEIYFSQSEPYTIGAARKLNLVVDKVLARPGYLIKPGDALFTAMIPGYEEELAKVKDSYEQKVRERAEKVAGSLRIKQTSEHNDYYNAMVKATDLYWEKLFEAKAAALRAGQELPDDIEVWGQGPTLPQKDDSVGDSGEETENDSAAEQAEVNAPSAEEEALVAMEKAMKEAREAKVAQDEATDLLRRIYTGQGSPTARTGDAVFTYIKEIDKMSEEIHDLLDQMMTLEQQRLELQTIRAQREGWLTEFALKPGDAYDGNKPAYALSTAGELPVLRCDISQVTKSIAKGMKVRLEGSERDLTISDVQLTADGKKYAIVELDEDGVSSLGGLSKLMGENLRASIIYKAQRTTTLLPASALRSSGENAYYVYVIQQNWGGMLGNSSSTVKKQDVTVIETSAKLVAVEDDLSYMEIADREDRALTDGQAVMEYVD